MLRLATTLLTVLVLVYGCDSREGSGPAASQPDAHVALPSPAASGGSNAAVTPAAQGASAGAPAKSATSQVAINPDLTRQNVHTGPAPATQPGSQALADARPGEWATYAGLNNRTIRYEVLGTQEDLVRIRVEAFEGGRPIGMPAVREERRDFNPLAKIAPVEGGTRNVTPRTRIEAAGRTWDATLYEDRWVSEDVHYTRKTWVSDQVPIFGTIRMELTGDGTLEAKLELTGCGPR